MSSRSLKVLTTFFFIILIGLISVAVLYTRTQENGKASRVFQTLITSAEQFVSTYQTMDTGLRAKSSVGIFNVINQLHSAEMFLIQDSKGDPLLFWQAPISTITPLQDTKSPSYLIPKTDFQTVVFESSLPGSIRIISAFKVLNNDDIERFAFAILALLGLWVVFLLVNLSISRNENENVVEALTQIRESTNMVNNQDKNNAGATSGENADSSEAIIEKKQIDYPRFVSVQEERPPHSDKAATNQDETAKSTTVITTPETGQDHDSRYVLIDRKSGVTQERFLRFRLDKELERNAENALDLSVALFRFQNLIKDDYSKAAGLLLQEFSHEDLIFEYGRDTFCIILPQHDLDQAIARSELVMRKVDGHKEITFKSDIELTVGLSSRNGRLIDASRFMKECTVALRKASREEGRIIGFRPDPVRFRNFLRHQHV